MIEIIGRPNEPAQFLTTSKIAWVGNLSEINSGPWHGSNMSWIRGRCLRYGNAPIATRLDFLRDSRGRQFLRRQTSMISMARPGLRIWGSGVRISSGAPFANVVS